MVSATRKGRVAAWHAGFLAMLPAIRRYLKAAFRGLDPEARDEAVQEGVCNALAAYVRLYERSKVDRAYATPLATYAARQIRAGRRVGGRLNIRDVSSPHCRRLKHVVLERLDKWDREEEAWMEIVVEDRHSSPADVARVRLDFAAWLKTLPRRDLAVALDLAVGHRTTDVARRYVTVATSAGLVGGSEAILKRQIERGKEWEAIGWARRVAGRDGRGWPKWGR